MTDTAAVVALLAGGLGPRTAGLVPKAVGCLGPGWVVAHLTVFGYVTFAVAFVTFDAVAP